MQQLKQAATVAAFLIVAGMLIHNLNALYLEPMFLGFEDKAADYADMAKIEDALWSFSFTSSGIAHIVVGFSLMILALFLSEFLRSTTPIGARLTFIAGMLAGLGFLLTGIADIPGAVYAGLIRGQNPAHNTEILLMATIFRSFVNVLAIVGLGWFAGQLSWCAMRAGFLPKWVRIFGWINVLPGIFSLIFPPAGFAYIQLVPVWMLMLGLNIRKLPDSAL